MGYKVTRIVGVKDDIEVVKLSCNRRTSFTKEQYTKNLLEFYDRHGVRLDYIDLEGHSVTRGEGGGNKPVVSLEDLDIFIKANPYMNQKEIANHYGIKSSSISVKISKIRGEMRRKIYG